MKIRSLYFTSKGEPRLKSSYCVFIDVLGFHALIDPDAKSRVAQQQFEWFYHIVSSRIEALNCRASQRDDRIGWHTKVFTDNMILGCRFEPYTIEKEFSGLFDAVAEHQLMMALEGIFVRGAWTVGSLFMDENVVYGPALLEAHKIEKDIACYPRIVFSETARGNVEFQMCCYENPDDAPHTRRVLVDSDGHAFVNYLFAIFDINLKTVNWNYLEKHKELVEKNLQLYRENMRVWAKYVWVAHYHNYFCSWLKEFDGFRQSFLIPNKLTDQNPRRLSLRNFRSLPKRKIISACK